MSNSLQPYVACQAPLSMGFSRQEYWSGLPIPSPGDLPNTGIEPRSPALAGRFLSTEPPGKPINQYKNLKNCCHLSNKSQRCTSPQFSSIAQSCPTLCDPKNHSTPGLPVHHQLPEFTQTRVYRVSDAIQPSHPFIPFSSCPQYLPASESFPMSQLFA